MWWLIYCTVHQSGTRSFSNQGEFSSELKVELFVIDSSFFLFHFFILFFYFFIFTAHRGLDFYISFTVLQCDLPPLPPHWFFTYCMFFRFCSFVLFTCFVLAFAFYVFFNHPFFSVRIQSFFFCSFFMSYFCSRFRCSLFCPPSFVPLVRSFVIYVYSPILACKIWL